MCGIVGYIGSKQAAPILIEALTRLEYRGYDSAGIAVADGNELSVVRAEGKLKMLRDRLGKEFPRGQRGIGHTRWATHGKPSDHNAHPHETDGVAVIHNGIIENFAELKNELKSKGRAFRSDTDTEVLAHLVAERLAQGDSFVQAVRSTLLRVTGAYAVVFMSKSDPQHLIAARVSSPLIIGLGDGENFIASDIPALLDHTRNIVALEEGELAIVSGSEVKLSTITGKSIERSSRYIDWTPAMAERGGYKHFMLKEIEEQPQVLVDTLRGRFNLEDAVLTLDEKEIFSTPIKRVVILGMGTSYHAGLLLQQYIERLARVPATIELASEFRYRDPVIEPHTLAIAISQSGETIDTLAAAKHAKTQGARLLTICNAQESSLARLADARLYTRAGIEIGVASTKAYTTQIAVGYLFALALAQHQHQLSKEMIHSRLRALLHVPKLMTDILDRADAIVPLAQAIKDNKGVFFLGRGNETATAYEGALKLKELAYIHAQGYAAGEMKHGPIALIDRHFYVIAIAPQQTGREKMLSSLQEVKAREGHIVGVISRDDKEMAQLCDLSFEIPEADSDLLPFLTCIPLQLLAYHVANLKGHDVDQPRNLAKSVTVE